MFIIKRVGEISVNSKGTPMKIISYRNGADIDVEFLDEFHYIKENQQYWNFRNGTIKNPYDKTVCGVGYLGVGIHTSIDVAKYNTWRDMLDRCYSSNNKHKHPSYYEISSVCDEWKNYQTFGDWYDKNRYYTRNERLQLDKDILITGNKIYSPETCILIPQGLNVLFLNKPNNRNLPNGVYLHRNGKYRAEYNNKEIGLYDTVEEAYEVYIKAKKSHIKQVADTYKGNIPVKVYKAVINHKFDINFDKNYIKELT